MAFIVCFTVYSLSADTKSNSGWFKTLFLYLVINLTLNSDTDQASGAVGFTPQSRRRGVMDEH